MNRKPVRGLKAALITGGVAATVTAATLPAAAAVTATPDQVAGPTRAAPSATREAHDLARLKSRLARARDREHRRQARLRRIRQLDRTPEGIARRILHRRGWSNAQWTCLDALWARESRWNVHAQNSSSGAYGIPQALPGDKMATRGADWRDNVATQIEWGLDYISAKYGSPCAADQHSLSYGYY